MCVIDPSFIFSKPMDMPYLVDDDDDDDDDDDGDTSGEDTSNDNDGAVDNPVLLPGLAGRQREALRQKEQVPIPKLHYISVVAAKVHSPQRRYFARVNQLFTDHVGRNVDVVSKVTDVVKSTACTNEELYFKYYPIAALQPSHNDEYEYTLCSS